MKFSCLSCASKYTIPDERVASGGASGLRIRCTKCRAIMVVSAEHPLQQAGVDTRPDLPACLKEAARSMTADAMPGDQAAAAPAPASLSLSGVYRPLPGVSRDVTGMFFGGASSDGASSDGASFGGASFDPLATQDGAPRGVSSRIWYAAVAPTGERDAVQDAGRSRGPFSATEMLALADKGKLRESSLVWRPGFKSWRRVRAADAADASDPTELGWLRRVVQERKRRELQAQAHALQRHGIQPIRLHRSSSGPSLSPTSGPPAGAGWSSARAEGALRILPPPVPFDEDLAGVPPQLAAPTLASPHHGSGPLDWRESALPRRTAGTSRAPWASMASRRALVGAAMACAVAVVVVVGALLGPGLATTLHGAPVQQARP